MESARFSAATPALPLLPGNSIPIATPILNELLEKIGKLTAECRTLQEQHKALKERVTHLELSREDVTEEVGAGARKRKAERALRQAKIQPLDGQTQKIIQAVAEHFHVDVKEILDPLPSFTLGLSRKIALYLCYKRLRLTYDQLCPIFGRDLSTLAKQVRKFKENLENKGENKALVDAIEKKLDAAPPAAATRHAIILTQRPDDV